MGPYSSVHCCGRVAQVPAPVHWPTGAEQYWPTPQASVPTVQPTATSVLAASEPLLASEPESWLSSPLPVSALASVLPLSSQQPFKASRDALVRNKSATCLTG